MYSNNFIETADNNFDLKKEFFKYLFYWKYFILAITICLFTAFFYIKYSSNIYDTTAKIKILDKKDSALEMPTAQDLFSSSKINLENEKELIGSYPILKKVVERLNLNLSVFIQADIKTPLITKDIYPFVIKSKIKRQDIIESAYKVVLKEEGMEIIDDQNDDTVYLFKDFTTTKIKHDLPFDIYNVDKDKIGLEPYLLKYQTTEQKVKELKKEIVLTQIGKESDILSINFNTSNIKYAQSIINELIDTYDQDGIEDRQLIHKRTIDFVDSRYSYLSQQLDSIENSKQKFKQENNLVDLSVNSVQSLEKSAYTEELIFTNANQIYVTNSLLEELTKLNFELLPSNIGINSTEINSLIGSYNERVLEHKKLLTSAGPNNPVTLASNNLINDSRSSIIFSLQTYLNQLNNLKEKQIDEFNKFDKQLVSVPLNEKLLRSINRNQETQEALYLFLLQKREEAEVSFAVTEPSIKVVEYAISKSIPLSPKIKIVYLGAVLIGLLLPFTVLYIFFMYNTKIQTREDILETAKDLNIIAEIPFFDTSDAQKIFINPKDRSLVSESFRMLMSNSKYLLKPNQCSVLTVTSSIKGEGKTLTAINLANAFASLDKKVLLVGFDLRNPQLHKYMGEDKNQGGVVNYLVDNKHNWKDNLLKPFAEFKSMDVLLCGVIPPNPLNLINNGNLDIFLEEAKKDYDYIILDSAPTLLVADSQSILEKSDAIIYLTRCNHTEKELINHISKLSKNKNLGVVLNGVGEKNAYTYGYGYGYSYGYKYNYGYGYGYGEDSN
ncbi:polysaccharide biosynthesis tyrosine autokinase [Flavobacteriales bacterium]|nr:polysaccharide biosynthesis tyrosine autokinase [Flavobacteriales bacterium]